MSRRLGNMESKRPILHPGQPPELRFVEQRDAVAALAQPLDFHQLDAAVAARRLLRVGTAAHDDAWSCIDGMPWTIAPARLAAAIASARRRDRMPVNARCTPLSERSTPVFSAAGRRPQRGDQLVGALVALAPLADAAVDDLLQLIAAVERADVLRCGSARARCP